MEFKLAWAKHFELGCLGSAWQQIQILSLALLTLKNLFGIQSEFGSCFEESVISELPSAWIQTYIRFQTGLGLVLGQEILGLVHGKCHCSHLWPPIYSGPLEIRETKIWAGDSAGLWPRRPIGHHCCLLDFLGICAILLALIAGYIYWIGKPCHTLTKPEFHTRDT